MTNLQVHKIYSLTYSNKFLRIYFTQQFERYLLTTWNIKYIDKWKQ